MCERAEEVVIEQSLSDMKFFTENEGKLGLNNYLMSPWILYVKVIPKLYQEWKNKDTKLNSYQQDIFFLFLFFTIQLLE